MKPLLSRKTQVCPAHGKVIHKYSHQAYIAMTRFMSARAYDGKHLSIYECKAGNGWHFGHTPSWMKAVNRW